MEVLRAEAGDEVLVITRWRDREALAEVPGVDERLFLEAAEAAKRDYAVSKALAGV